MVIMEHINHELHQSLGGEMMHNKLFSGVDNKKCTLVLKEIRELMGKRRTINFKEIVTKTKKIRELDTKDLMNALIYWDSNNLLNLQMKKPA